MSEVYGDRQFVGIDVHRRRSVLVRLSESGQRLESTKIANSPEALAAVMARAGESPEVVLEATYGWFWAADTLAGLGANVHLAHPLGVKAFSYRRVKNDERDAEDLADLLRMGRLPEAWISTPATRELRELVRHRAKLVAMRTSMKCQIHAVLAGAGVTVSMSDLFGTRGRELLGRLELGSSAARTRIGSALSIVDVLDLEIDTVSRTVSTTLAGDRGYQAIQQIPGVGPVLAAVFVAEIGDVTRFRGPDQLACWAGLTPRHHESDTTVRRGRISKQGSRLVRWAAVEAAQHSNKCEPLAALRERVSERRGKNVATVAAARKLIGLVFYGLRDHEIRCLSRAA